MVEGMSVVVVEGWSMVGGVGRLRGGGTMVGGWIDEEGSVGVGGRWERGTCGG